MLFRSVYGRKLHVVLKLNKNDSIDSMSLILIVKNHSDNVLHVAIMNRKHYEPKGCILSLRKKERHVIVSNIDSTCHS